MKRRGRTAAAAPSASEQLLFGGSLTYEWGFSRHEMAAHGLSPRALARRVPAMLSTTARLAWVADRAALLALSLAEVGQGVARAVALILTNRVLLALFAAGTAPHRVSQALPALIAASTATGCSALLSAVSTAATGRLEPTIENAVHVEFLSRAIRVKLSGIQDAEFHRLLDSSQFAADAARRMIGQSVAVVNALINLVAVGGVLATLDLRLLPLLPLIAAPKAWGAIRSAGRRYASLKAWVGHLRATRLLTNLLTNQTAAGEIRVHGVGPFLLKHFTLMSRQTQAEQTRVARAKARTELAASTLSGAATVLTYLVLVLLLASGQLPLAVAGTAVLAIRTGVGSIANLVTQLNMLYESALYIADLEELRQVGDRLSIPVGGTDLPTAPAVLKLKDITFRYPGLSKPALDRVSLTVEPGTVVALVRVNGSGKTTLAQVISGLLEADGEMTWGGVDIREADRDQWFSRVGLLAQDFQRWPLTATANIALGRPDAAGDEERLLRAARWSEADDVVADLAHAWDTILAKGYTRGAEISGGQWQRLGMARARFRDAQLLIADEPTSALDAESEVEAFERIRSLADDGTTVILITHRLGATAHADHIYVLEDGRISEHGRHEDLMASTRPGGYRSLYLLQASQYTAEARIGPQRDNAEQAERS